MTLADRPEGARGSEHVGGEKASRPCDTVERLLPATRGVVSGNGPRGNPKLPWRVVVLQGGPSLEREISLKSGAAVIAALQSLGHHVTAIDPAEVDLDRCDWSQTDVVFIALHGTYGEDGQVQQWLEDHDLPYTGSGPRASQMAFSKSAAKERFLQAHLPTPSYVLIHQSDSASEIAAHVRQIGFPLVIKPDAQGSSLGVTLVREEQELPAALTACFALGEFGLIESAIAGTEWTVGFLDDEVLPPILIETDHEFFDFEAKYTSDETRYLCDPPVAAELKRCVIQAAIGARAAVGTSGLARVDLRVDHHQRPWILEVNTVPGLTDHSLVPKAAAHRGWGFAELCQRSLESALRLHQLRRERGRAA